MNSYVTPYASPARSSHVSTPARTLSSFSRVVPLAEPPSSVVVSPRVDHLGLGYGRTYEIRSAAGALVYRGQNVRSATLTLLDDGYMSGGTTREWDGRAGNINFHTGLSSDAHVLWALEIGDTTGGFIVSSGATPFAAQVEHEGTTVRVWDSVGPRFALSSERIQSRTRAGLIWREHIMGSGCGAIAADRRFVLALESCQFIVLDGNHSEIVASTGQRRGQRLVEV